MAIRNLLVDLFVEAHARPPKQIILDLDANKGFVGMNRWVGLGVIADNLINIGRAMQRQSAP